MEIWKNIPGYEGHYQASNFGRIKSLDKTIFGNCGQRGYGFTKIKGRILKQCMGSSPYFQVHISVMGNHHTFFVHSLIAKTFLGKRPIRFTINHKDSDKSNNRIENLEYITHKENKKSTYMEIFKTIKSSQGSIRVEFFTL